MILTRNATFSRNDLKMRHRHFFSFCKIEHSLKTFRSCHLIFFSFLETLVRVMPNNTNSTIDDDQSYWISVFTLLNVNISRYGMSLIWLIGNLGSITNCFIFLQPNLRKNSCIMYLMASSASQFLLLIFLLSHEFFNLDTIFNQSILFFGFVNFAIIFSISSLPFHVIILSWHRSTVILLVHPILTGVDGVHQRLPCV